jgi:hypothetical protein
MGALRSLAAKPAGHVATIAPTIALLSVRERRLVPGHKGARFANLVAGATLASSAYLKFICPGSARDLFELIKKKLVNRVTHSFFEFAHKVLFDEFIVSRQGPRGVAHV